MQCCRIFPTQPTNLFKKFDNKAYSLKKIPARYGLSYYFGVKAKLFPCFSVYILAKKESDFCRAVYKRS